MMPKRFLPLIGPQMKYLATGILLLFTTCAGKESLKEPDKVGYLKKRMKEIGFMNLPFTYDIASSKIDAVTPMDHNSMDTLFFASGQFQGVLPDTTKFYCILYYQTGDSLYPFLTTIDKGGNVLDTKNIGIGYCGGFEVEIDECIDQVTIKEDMTLELLYKATQTVKNDTTPKTTICNTITGIGKIREDGQIQITKTETDDCE